MKSKLISVFKEDENPASVRTHSLFEVLAGDQKVYVEHSHFSSSSEEDGERVVGDSYRIVSVDMEPFEDTPFPKKLKTWLNLFYRILMAIHLL
ncbi:MAG: hypothetical protein Q7S72_01460 [Candidatus Taylorbacteria bacterium]|nr:hypothetical protein [Candidatus Taylorbacteria bacterium]